MEFELLIRNLLANAFSYRLKDIPLKVRIFAKRDKGRRQWTLGVEDNGLGTPKSAKKDLFHPFVRGAETQEIPGSGLGLAICQRVAERHGGSIRFVSTSGHGSTFFFTVKD